MNALQKFLIENDVTKDTNTFKLDSPRLRKFDFTVSGITNSQYMSYQKLCVTGKGKNRDMDVSKFNMQIILNHCVEPNFRDADSIKAKGVETPEAFVNSSLRAGEVQQLAEKILELSGFNIGGVVEMEEEAKN